MSPAEQPASTEPPNRLEIFRNTLADLLDTPPHILLGLRFAEDAARQVTEDQWVLELFQNARDAVVNRGKAGARVRVVITEDAILVANDGQRFDRAGYEAVTGVARSTKSDHAPGGAPKPLQLGSVRTMGRHGIGFKSLLQATDRPQLFANSPGDDRLALEFGAPRVTALCAALVDRDESALDRLLSAREREVLRAETAPPLPLESRSLLRHLGRRGVGREELLARLPVFPLPLWVDDLPREVPPLLGWDGDGGELPFDTVIRLPLRAKDADRVCSHLRAELIPARRVFLGVHVKIETRDESGRA